PKPADAPLTEFSAGRAREVLRGLVGDGQPHPTGSLAAGRVRQRIVSQLEQLGYAPEIQEKFACGAVRLCARVTNVLARLDGTGRGKAVLLSVHYDSVPAGPGASDDGIGVAAALEVARALKAGPQPKNPVFFLFNEGEEDDLLGAEAFTSSHPWTQQIGAVVNLEARGTTGPSLMFETSDESGWIVDLFARSAPRPASNSIYYTIYKLLPNDTDLTVYKRRGLSGLNFAFIGGESRYHTPRDDFAHASAASLQHHGDNALAMVHSLAQADLESPPRSELVFFDVLTFGIVRWPLRWMPVLAVLAAALLAVAAVRAGRRGELQGGAVAWGLGAFALAVIGTGAAGMLVFLVLRATGAVPYPWVAHPAPARAAFLALPVLVSGGAAVWLGRRAGSAGLWWGTWAAWGIASLATGFAAPGLSYPFVLPCLVAAICELAGARRLALLLPLALAALLWCPIAWLLYDGLGMPILAGSAALLAIVLSTAAPAWIEPGTGRRCVAIGAAAVVAVGGIAAAFVPRFSRDNPRKLNLWYRFDPGGDPVWLASANTGRLPPSLSSAVRFGAQPVPALPWLPKLRAYSAQAPRVLLAAPQLLLEEQRAQGSGRWIRARLRSNRAAAIAGFAVPRDRVASVRMNGVGFTETASKNLVAASITDAADWRTYVCTTTGSEGVDVELEVVGTGPVEVHLWDASPGLPLPGGALLSARPDWAVPFNTGDRTVVIAKTTL
ncbi:MAG TPA: M20/M25/M40 family metallo-hydrolase, partial [Myxococcales bacterium]|nr:M20/M25/M40 family metallo-hydrolase [Myxococcales bacterium]